MNQTAAEVTAKAAVPHRLLLSCQGRNLTLNFFICCPASQAAISEIGQDHDHCPEIKKRLIIQNKE
jgi:hypothetical protein